MTPAHTNSDEELIVKLELAGEKPISRSAKKGTRAVFIGMVLLSGCRTLGDRDKFSVKSANRWAIENADPAFLCVM